MQLPTLLMTGQEKSSQRNFLSPVKKVLIGSKLGLHKKALFQIQHCMKSLSVDFYLQDSIAASTSAASSAAEAAASSLPEPVRSALSTVGEPLGNALSHVSSPTATTTCTIEFAIRTLFPTSGTWSAIANMPRQG